MKILIVGAGPAGLYLAYLLKRQEMRHDIRIVNVFHAGDGNIHPILLFDERDAEQVKRVLLASDEILNRCIELGGSVTGEHGIGVEKISFMNKLFTEADLEKIEQLAAARRMKEGQA